MKMKVRKSDIDKLVKEAIAEARSTRKRINEVEGVDTSFDAIELYDAMKGLGTDEEAVRKVLRKRQNDLGKLYDEFNSYAGGEGSSDDLVDWLAGDGMPEESKYVEDFLKSKNKSRYTPGLDPKDVEGRKELTKGMQGLDIDKIIKGEASESMMSELDKLTTKTWQTSGFNNKKLAGRAVYYIVYILNNGFSELKQIATKPKKTTEKDGTVTIQGRGDFQGKVRSIMDTMRTKKYLKNALAFLSWFLFGPLVAKFKVLLPAFFGTGWIAGGTATAGALATTVAADVAIDKTAAGLQSGSPIAKGAAAAGTAYSKLVNEQEEVDWSAGEDDYGMKMKNKTKGEFLSPSTWDPEDVANVLQDVFGVTGMVDAFLEALDDDALNAQKYLGNALYLVLIREDVKSEGDALRKISELFKGLAQNVKIPDAPKIRDAKEKKAKELPSKEKDDDSISDDEMLAALGVQDVKPLEIDPADPELIAQISY